MQPTTPAVRYADFAKPAEGQATSVADGVHWFRFRLPFRLNHVNLWAIEDDGDTLTIVDTGLGDQDSRQHWEALFAGPLAGRRVTRVVATHYHPDHIGLAGWIVERFGAEFVTGLAEWLYARVLAKSPAPASVEAARIFYRQAGTDPTLADYVIERGGAFRHLVGPIPATLNRLRVGQSLIIGGRRWEMIDTSGHSPEPVSLYCGDLNVLLAGDQMLPRISPNISVWPGEPDADPLDDFLGSFPALYRLPADVLVLPSHDKPFYGLHTRLDELQAHHAARLDEMAEVCRSPQSAQHIVERVFPGDLDLHQQMFALGEVMAHLNHLIRRNRVTRTPDENGVWHYRTVS